MSEKGISILVSYNYLKWTASLYLLFERCNKFRYLASKHKFFRRVTQKHWSHAFRFTLSTLMMFLVALIINFEFFGPRISSLVAIDRITKLVFLMLRSISLWHITFKPPGRIRSPRMNKYFYIKLQKLPSA